MTSTLTLNSRTDSGKGAARRLREQGLIPGVIYGAKKDVTSVSINAHDLMMIVKEGGFYSTVLDVEVNGKKEQVLPRELQRHPVKGTYLHLDMLRFDAKRKILVSVPIHIEGEAESPGVKSGGIVQHVRTEVEVRCLASKIPSEFIVSVAGFNVGDSVHFSSIELPEGVELTTEEDFTIASVVSTRSNADDADDAAELEATEGEAAAAEASAETAAEEKTE